MPTLRSTAVLLVTALLATPAAALEVSQSVEVAAPPEKVWEMIGAFCSIADWHPVVGKCAESQQNGAAMRKLTTVDGGVLVEKRVQYSDEGMSYTYVIVDSPLPVSDYTSTLAVMGMGGGSMITWSGEFAAKGAPDDKAVEVITGIYQAGLEALKDRLK
jgi:Polyketide cyclase / dehydrase and lipid transport